MRLLHGACTERYEILPLHFAQGHNDRSEGLRMTYLFVIARHVSAEAIHTPLGLPRFARNDRKEAQNDRSEGLRMTEVEGSQ